MEIADWTESETMANGTRKPMRQGQQNRRGRGRGRKVQNNLSRNLESNGPDVKIRGTAAHIAEKYATLARDALSSGDTVAGENYLQHAEHYNRIIMANQQAQQAQQAQQQTEQANGSSQPKERGSGNGADTAGNEQPGDDASGAEASSQAAASEKIADDDGLARTMARTVKRSANGAKAEADGEAESSKASKPSSDDGKADSKDEAVT